MQVHPELYGDAQTRLYTYWTVSALGFGIFQELIIFYVMLCYVIYTWYMMNFNEFEIRRMTTRHQDVSITYVQDMFIQAITYQ